MNKQQVEKNMIVLTKAGSHSYGTNIESSDEDDEETKKKLRVKLEKDD